MYFVDQPHPVNNLATIFTARRDLLRPIKKKVTPGSDLTVEQADLLITLWDETIPRDREGYMTFAAVRDLLVHNPALLSRRIAALVKAGLVETVSARDRNLSRAERRKVHGNTAYVKITASGKRRIEPLWARYMKLAERLLSGVSDLTAAELKAHIRVNEVISKRIREMEQEE